MFCEKCGAQLPDDAKFCEACGSSTEPGAAAGPGVAAAVGTAAPSATSLAIKKFFSNKRNVFITLAALLLIIAVIVVIIVIASQPKKIYIDDYFDIVFEGTDGYGNAYLRVSDEQREKLEKLNKKLFPDEDHHIGLLVTPSLDISDDRQGALKNGDKVNVKLDVGDFYKYVDGYKVLLRNKTVKVKGLKEVKEVNLLELFKPSFSGVNGYGRISSEEQTVSLPHGYTATVECSYSSLYIRIYDGDGYNIASLYYEIDKYEYLSNGDTVTVTADSTDSDREYLATSYALRITDTTKTYTVSGLTEPQTFDFTKHVLGSFTGYSHNGVMTLVLPMNDVAVNDCAVRFSDNSDSYSRRFSIDIYNGSGEHIDNLSYYADRCDDLKNGDTVTFETYSDTDYLITQTGILFPETFTITVSGLTEPVVPDVIGRGSLTFSGYNGYGTYEYTLPEDKCVYTIGDYTFKLTLTEYSYEYRINVVIADAAGTNFYSFDYYFYSSSSLTNGGILTFNSTAYSSELEDLLEERGIYIPDYIEIEIKDLPETTMTNPLEQAEYSFRAEDGDVIIVCSLKTTSYTVGEYTIRLGLEEYSSWGTDYIKLNYTLYDGDTAVGGGYYQIQKNDHYEGKTVYTRHYGSDDSEIARATGIVFNSESFPVIVSSK